MCKYSIITISFNSKATIEKTILSVINQNYADKEYIIIDGGSTDGTLEIIDKYRDHIDIVVSEKDEGISDAFNKGIRRSKGEFVLLLNSDDVLLDGVLTQVDRLIEADTDVFHTNINYLDEQGRFVTTLKPLLDYNILLYRRMTLNHPGMFIRRVAYEKYGLYDTSYKCVMDRELLTRMYMKGAKFQYAEITTVDFALGGESTVNYIKHAIPEGTRISIRNGTNPVVAYIYAFYRYARTRAKPIRTMVNRVMAGLKSNIRL